MTAIDTGLETGAGTDASGGVSFALSPEQKELRALAREFATNEIRPIAAEHDERQLHAGEVVRKAHELGLLNLHVPAALGGLELSCFDGMLVLEELNWGCTGIGTTLSSNGLAAGPILVAGSEEQKRTWLSPLIEAPILGCFGLTEPGAGSDVSGDPDHGRSPAATSTSSTARRCSSRTRATPRGWSASSRPTAVRAIAGSARS